jgi:hypothetical protein
VTSAALARLHSAIADLSNGALSTLRILTLRNESGEGEATDAVFRMAVGTNTIVDNFHAGGIAANVDMVTGVLGLATDIGLRPDLGWCDRHPTTGAKIFGRRLPFWEEAIDLVQRGHALFPNRTIIGWDVAILESGPCAVESNGSPDLDIHQRCGGAPLGRARLGELLAFSVEQALAARAALTPASEAG